MLDDTSHLSFTNIPLGGTTSESIRTFGSICQTSSVPTHILGSRGKTKIYSDLELPVNIIPSFHAWLKRQAITSIFVDANLRTPTSIPRVHFLIFYDRLSA